MGVVEDIFSEHLQWAASPIYLLSLLLILDTFLDAGKTATIHYKTKMFFINDTLRHIFSCKCFNI